MEREAEVEKLRALVRIPTVSRDDEQAIDPAPFEQFHRTMADAFPPVARTPDAAPGPGARAAVPLGGRDREGPGGADGAHRCRALVCSVTALVAAASLLVVPKDAFTD